MRGSLGAILGKSLPAQAALHRQEVARGLLLLCVFYMHALFVLVDHVGGPEAAPIAWTQNRLAAAQVALFFVLAGQSAKDIGSRGVPFALSRSLMLLILAAISHMPVAIIAHIVQAEQITQGDFLGDVAEPVILGTGYWTSMPWFFVVLASTRLLAYALQRSKPWFAVWLLAVAAAAFAADRSGLTDNLYEWRNLPVALPLFLAGMYLPAGWSPPRWLAIVSAVGLPLTVFANSAGGACFNCDPTFVAQPFVGQMGSPPLLYLSLVFGYCVIAYGATMVAGGRLARLSPIVRPFGKHSLLLLLMHGWLLVTLYPFAAGLLPGEEIWPLYLALAVVIPLLHWGLFLVLRRFLTACYNFANNLARRIVGGVVYLLQARGRLRAPAAPREARRARPARKVRDARPASPRAEAEGRADG